MPPELTSVARPKQARSHQTLARILDAAERLITERGIAGVSVADIVRTAGSSVGGFYSRFRDKDGLLLALQERLIGQIDDRVAELERPERFAGASLQDIVRVCIGELVRVNRERRALLAAVTARAAQNEELRVQGLRFRADVIARFVRLVLTRHAQIGHPDPETAADLGAQMMFGLMDQFVILGELRAGGELLSDERVAQELQRSFLTYLDVRPA